MNASSNNTVPVFANRAPWNELVLRKKRKVKTLSFNWKYRGPILLYTSKDRIDYDAWYEYPSLKRVKVDDIPKGFLVGTAEVVDVIPTDDLPQKYHDEDPALFGTTGQAFLVLIENVKRFKKPMAFKPPKGAIRIMKAPASLLKRATV